MIKQNKSEAKIQSKVISNYEKLGYYVIRLKATQKDGIADLIALKADGCPRIIFHECKKEKGGVVSELQRYRKKELKSLGFHVVTSASEKVPPPYCREEIVCHNQCDSCKQEIDELYP